MLTFGWNPTPLQSKPLLAPSPTRAVPTSWRAAVVAAVAGQNDGLEDQSGAPAPTKKTVSQTTRMKAATLAFARPPRTVLLPLDPSANVPDSEPDGAGNGSGARANTLPG